MVSDLLAEVGREDLVESARLLVSELVTNALLQAGTQVELTVSAADAGVLVLVGDGSATTPPRGVTPGNPHIDRAHVLVDHLASAWGVMSHAHGKVVWFQLDRVPGGVRVEIPGHRSESP